MRPYALRGLHRVLRHVVRPCLCSNARCCEHQYKRPKTQPNAAVRGCCASWGETKHKWRDQKHFSHAGLLISHMRGWGECRIRCDWFWLPASSQPRNHTGACSVHPLLCRNVDPKLILECNGRPDGVCSGPLQGVHELLPQPSEVLYITVLRDPVKRTTSGLNYNRIVKANTGETGACWRVQLARIFAD